MDIREMGVVFQYLLRHRVIESNKKNSRHGCSEIISILMRADMDDIDRFNEFLSPQAMILKKFTDTDYNSIPAGVQMWLLLRSSEESAPEYLSIKRIAEAIKIKEGEGKDICNVWFLHIWLIYLSLIYTRLGRGVSQVSVYTDALFLEEELIGSVKDHIDNVRHVVSLNKQNIVAEIIDKEKGTDVSRRVKGFLSLMCDSSLLSLIGVGEYQQTLLGAVEIAEGFNRSLSHVIPEEPVLDNISKIMIVGEDTNIRETRLEGEGDINVIN